MQILSTRNTHCIDTMHHENKRQKHQLHSPCLLTEALAVESVCDQDVLCGRDKHSTDHRGNRRFRAIVQLHSARYQSARRRIEKTEIAREVVATIDEEGGRFIRFDDDLDCWVQLDSVEAHEKVSHALRSVKMPKRAPSARCISIQPDRATIDIPDDEVEEDRALEEVFCIQQRIFANLTEKHYPGRR